MKSKKNALNSFDDLEKSYYYENDYKYESYKNKIRKIETANVNTLIKLLEEYDQMRYKIEKIGGNLQDVTAMSELMQRKVSFQGYYETLEASLADPQSLREMIHDLSDYHIDIRRRDTGLPVYFLCRIKKGYWGESSIIVEDIYKSSDYVIDDERFVKLVSMGKESYFLHLSQLRDNLKLSSKLTSIEQKQEKDKILYDLGHSIFQIAWHEDQRMGILTAREFDIKYFSDAIELLYLCLNSELCELRSSVDDKLLKNYMSIYPCKPIADFITKIKAMEGSDLDKLPNAVIKQYARISKGFNKFLKTEVKWGKHNCIIPLYKILFSNFSRMSSAAERLKQEPQIKKGRKELEELSLKITSDILSL